MTTPAATDAPSATEAPDGTEAPATTAAPSETTAAPSETTAAPSETTAPPPPTNPPPADIGTGSGEGGTIRLWLNGVADTPDPMVEYAVAEFNKVHPDVKAALERQQWDGIVERNNDRALGRGRS